ncbi:MAG: metal-dependent hydrolase [Thermoplasmata archaeon]
MKWINHKISTFSLVFLLTHDIVSSAVAAAGSIFPDAIEGHDYDSDRWRKNHRRASHWLLGYFIVGFILWLLFYLKTEINPISVHFVKFVSGFRVFNSETMIFAFLYITFYVVVGCILHVLEDSLSSSVPLIHPTRRTFSIGIMRVGSPAEYLVSFGLFASVILWK